MARCLPISVRLLVLLLLTGLPSCQSYRHTLQRGQGYYESNQYEMALAVWRDLERDTDALNEGDLVRYCYLRGMTDYRLGYRRDARYWLGLSKASQGRAVGALQEDEELRLDRTLADLNEDVFGDDRAGAAAQQIGDACKWTSDCESGFVCQENMCVIVEGSTIGATRAGGAEDEIEVP